MHDLLKDVKLFNDKLDTGIKGFKKVRRGFIPELRHDDEVQFKDGTISMVIQGSEGVHKFYCTDGDGKIERIDPLKIWKAYRNDNETPYWDLADNGEKWSQGMMPCLATGMHVSMNVGGIFTKLEIVRTPSGLSVAPISNYYVKLDPEAIQGVFSGSSDHIEWKLH